MEQKSASQQELPHKSTPNNILKVILGILLLAIIGIIVWLMMTKADLNDMKAEKEQQRQRFIAELDSLLSEHDQIKEEYGQLADTLYAKDSLIRQNAKDIKKLLNYKWEYYKINKKVKKLQVIAQGYVRQMDSLYTENKILKEENIQITRKYNRQVSKTKELETMRERLEEKVSQAEVLQTYNLKAEGLQVKYNGNKQKPTDKAKRVNKIKFCFTLSENPILSQGDKKLYIRIARPDKLILTPSRGDNYSFDYQGEKLQYSIMKEVNYEGIAKDICLYWSKKSAKEIMSPGTYHVEIFEGDNVIGHTSFSLR